MVIPVCNAFCAWGAQSEKITHMIETRIWHVELRDEKF